MSRKKWLLLVFVSSTLALSLFFLAKQKKEPMSKPNIMLFVMDAIRHDQFSFDKSIDINPYMRELSEKGIFFSNATTPATWTYPTHASILTGIMPFKLQIDLHMANQSYIDPQFPTAFQLLNQVGYQTVLVADNGGAVLNPSGRNSLRRGLNYFDSFQGGNHNYSNLGPEGSEDRLATYKRQKGGPGIKPLTVQEVQKLIKMKPEEVEFYPELYSIFKKDSYFEDRYEGLLRFFSEKYNKEQPFFVFLNLHHQLQRTMCKDNIFKLWFIEYIKANNKEGQLKKLLGANTDFTLPHLDISALSDFEYFKFYERFTITFSDCVIRRMAQYLKDNGLFEETVFLVTTDHGLTFTEHDGRPDGHGLVYPYESLVKTFLTINFGSRVPFDALKGTYPKRINIVDIFPTLIHMADKKLYSLVKKEYPSVSLLDRVEQKNFDKVIVSESLIGPNVNNNKVAPAMSFAFLDDNLKLLYCPTCEEEAMLFDVVRDSKELKDISVSYTQETKKLKDFADNYIKDNGYLENVISKNWLKEYNREDPTQKPKEELTEYLRGLGYIQ